MALKEARGQGRAWNGLEGHKKVQDSALDGVGDSDSAWEEE